MRNQDRNIVHTEMIAGQQVPANFKHLPRRVLEDLAAILMDKMLAAVDCIMRCRQAASSRRLAQELPPATIDLSQKIDISQVRFIAGSGLDQHCAGAVAEQYAGSTVGVVDDAAHRVAADH